MGIAHKEEDIIMNCYECGGEIVQCRSNLIFYRRDGSPVFFEDVALGECVQCGEKYLSGTVTEKISAALEADSLEHVRHLSVPVVHLAA